MHSSNTGIHYNIFKRVYICLLCTLYKVESILYQIIFQSMPVWHGPDELAYGALGDLLPDLSQSIRDSLWLNLVVLHASRHNVP